MSIRSSKQLRPFLLAFFCAAFPTMSQALVQSDLCSKAAKTAARQSDVPVNILQSISLVETGKRTSGTFSPWPWTINYAGQGYWFETKTEAVEFASKLINAGIDNFDVGCFQINLHWHPDAFSSLHSAFDPELNAGYAAEFLEKLYATRQDWHSSIAAYHSISPDRGKAYLKRVLDALKGTGSIPPETFASQQDQDRSVNRFPLLIAGAGTQGPSLVPSLASGQPLFVVAR